MRNLLFSLVILFIACSKNEEVDEKGCIYIAPSQRVSKKIKTNLSPTNKLIITERYFYDTNINLDSTCFDIDGENYYATKYKYNSSNALIELSKYDFKNKTISTYSFEYDQDGNLASLWSISKNGAKTLYINFGIDEVKKVKNYKYTFDGDSTDLSYDDCNNVIAIKTFETGAGYETSLNEAQYTSITNPLYFKNIPLGIENFENSPFLLKNRKMVHAVFNCFGPRVLRTDYKLNSKNLPISSKTYTDEKELMYTTEYFY